MAEVDITYLVPELRLRLFDLEEPYTYSDTTLSTGVLSAIKLLGRRWRNRYLVVSGYDVKRNPSIDTFVEDEPPVIEPADEAVIILQASIIIKTAHSYNSVWDVASWKDDEVSYSNIQSAKSRDLSIQRDYEELETLLKTRLYAGKYSPLPGYHKNTTETGI